MTSPSQLDLEQLIFVLTFMYCHSTAVSPQVVVSTFISAQAVFRDPDGFDVDVVGAIEPG